MARTEKWPIAAVALALAGCGVAPTPAPSNLALTTPPIGTPIATPIATRAPAPTTVPTAGAPGYQWTPIDPEPFAGIFPPAVTTDPDQGTMVVFGSPTGDGTGSDPIADGPSIWESADGAGWGRFTAGRRLGPSRSGWQTVVRDVRRDGAGWVAVGEEIQGDGSSAVAVAWWSPDGIEWTRADVQSPDGRTMEQLYATPTGLVAEGEDDDTFHAGFGGGSAIWTSDDRGRTWTRTLQEESVAPGARLGRVVRAGANGPYFATVREEHALGLEPVRRDEVTDYLWRSADGIHWTPSGTMPEQIDDLAWSGATFVAVGVPSGVPSAWTSTDGATWRRARLPFPPGPVIADFVAATVVAGPDGFLATASRFDEQTETSTTTFWTSPDGASWTRLTVPAGAESGVELRPAGAAILAIGGRAETGGRRAWRLDPGTLLLGREAAISIARAATAVPVGVEGSAVVGAAGVLATEGGMEIGLPGDQWVWHVRFATSTTSGSEAMVSATTGTVIIQGGWEPAGSGG